MGGPKDELIDWRRSAREIHYQIRAVTDPYPCAVGMIQGRILRIRKALPDDVSVGGPPGTVKYWIDEGPVFACGDGRGLLFLSFFEETGGIQQKLKIGDQFNPYDYVLTKL